MDELCELSDDLWSVRCVGHSEPFARGVEHAACSLARVDEVVYHGWDIELGFEFVTMLAEEVDEERLGMFEVVGCEGPHIHRDGCVVSESGFLVTFDEADDAIFFAQNLGALGDGSEEALFVGLTHATCYGTGFGQGVSDAVTEGAICRSKSICRWPKI